MMIRAKKESVAAEMARENGQLYGMSVFDGYYYTGNAEELRNVGATPINDAPEPAKTRPLKRENTPMLTIDDFPTVEELARAMAHLPGLVEPEYRESEDDTPHIDVRLQVWSEGTLRGEWALRTGDASYDQDHRGYWGAGCVTADDTPDTLKALANEMIEQAIDDAAQNDDFEDTDGEPEDETETETGPWTVVWYDPDRNGGQIVVEEANTRRAKDAPADAGMPPGCDYVVFEGSPGIVLAAPIDEPKTTDQRIAREHAGHVQPVTTCPLCQR